jgi:type VI secretion system protein
MPLILHLASTDPALGEGGPRRIEVPSRLTIGRGSDNDLVLPDPRRHLSKNHCVIDFDGRSCTITDTSTNGVFMNDGAERLPQGTAVPLSEGSVLKLGGYEITVTAIAPSHVPAPAPPQSGFGGSRPTAADDGLFGDPLAGGDPLGGADPLAARFPHPAQGGAAPHGSAEDPFGFAPSGAAPPTGSMIPEDADLFGASRPEEQWHGASQADHAPSDQAFFALPKATTEKIPDDWDLSDLGVTPGPASRPQIPADRGFAEAAPAARRAPPAAPAIGGTSAGDGAAVAAFLAAVGLAGTNLSEAERVRLMRLAGETLATTVKGLTEILAARASTKQEFRIDRTTIAAAGNNPLKFSASLEEAMRVMLLGRTPGFLPAKEAVAEALGDIKGHQLAVLAGMQVALMTVIQRFDPAKLEKRLDQSSLIEGILPGARKARYWALFKTLYKEIASELQDDFQKAFGAEFARAYKEQIDRL